MWRLDWVGWGFGLLQISKSLYHSHCLDFLLRLPLGIDGRDHVSRDDILKKPLGYLLCLPGVVLSTSVWIVWRNLKSNQGYNTRIVSGTNIYMERLS